MGTPLRTYSEHTWNSFVRPSVRFKPSNPDTRALIEQMMPYFPKSCVVIAAFLDDADQFWKINYHWELLSLRTDMAMKFRLAAGSIALLKQIRESLDANRPGPAQGYVNSKVVGKPHDRSTNVQITDRWRRLRESKSIFRAVLDAEKIPRDHPPSEAWDLAAAPVARPGTSKHGCGYAFDIGGHGKNQLIKDIAQGLGATLRFDEKSHVHVEFKQGVVAGKALVDDDLCDGRWAGWKRVS
jgi:hypothetical protein